MSAYENLRINEGFALYQETPGAVLVDVRTPDEYAQGHLPGAINVELAYIQKIGEVVDGFDTPLFTYCTMGVRSDHAAAWLVSVGFTRVASIGGIVDWTGELE